MIVEAIAASRSIPELVADFPSLQSANIILPTANGREIRLRRVPEPNAGQKSHQPSRACRTALGSLAYCDVSGDYVRIKCDVRCDAPR
jgi:hypothetical protein